MYFKKNSGIILFTIQIFFILLNIDYVYIVHFHVLVIVEFYVYKSDYLINLVKKV